MSTRKSLDAQHQGFFMPALVLVCKCKGIKRPEMLKAIQGVDLEAPRPSPPILAEQGWQSCLGAVARPCPTSLTNKRIQSGLW